MNATQRYATRRFASRTRRALGKGAFALSLCATLIGLSRPAHAAPPDHVIGRILIKFREEVPEAQKQNVLNGMGAKSAHALGKLKVHVVDLADGQDENEVVAEMQARDDVEFAELDRLVKPAQAPTSVTPNDTSYSAQWHLSNISAPYAWAITTGSPNLIVAVLDSGCDPTHPDLKPNYVAGWNFVDNNTDTHDVFGHGTAVAGCVGAAGNNTTGIASVSWSSKIMPCRVTDLSGNAYVSSLASALQWAADHGAKVANMSFDGILGQQTILSAAQYMYNKGGLVVCAAGNSNTNPGYAASPYIICVSATDANNAKASWSNYGNFVTVSAPGTNIYTTNNGGGYGGWNGTSFSAPITCGVIAEIWAANPYLSNAQAQQVLVSNATDLGTAGWDANFGYGKVDVYRAVVSAQNTVVDTIAPSTFFSNPVNGTTVAGTVAVSIDASDNVGVTKVEFYVDGALNATLTATPYTVNWNTSSLANSAHTLVAKAYDAAGNVGTSSAVSVTVANAVDTAAPICAITSPSSGAKVSNPLTVTVSASDNIGVTSVVLYLDGKQVATTSSAPYSFSLNTRKWAVGAHTLQAVALDAAGNRGSSATITVNK